MGIVAVIPLFWALYVAIKKSPQAAFLEVYVPVLILIPDYYHWQAPGLPDPNFHESALLPIVGLWILQGAQRWKFSFTDILVFGFAACVGYSEFRAAGYAEAQNLMFDMVASVVLPYIAGKVFIEAYGQRVAFAKAVIVNLTIVVFFCLYESKMGVNPFQIMLGRFFPYQGDGWVTTFRYGLARVAGPYGHAILAGVVFIAGYRIAKWLEWTGSWEPTFKRFPKLPWSKGRVYSVIMLAGLILTLVRGPWMGAIVGASMTMIGRAQNRKMALWILFAALFVVGVPAGIAMYQYASVGRANAKSDSQETAAYRKELIDKYVDIALEHATWGWGRNTWPKVQGMPSIDNYYLLLALMHGMVALSLLLMMIVITSFRLVSHAMSMPPPSTKGGSLGFTLAAIYIGFGFSIATVFMGTTVIPLFALLTGWSDGYLNSTSEETAGSRASVPALMPIRRFARVVQ